MDAQALLAELEARGIELRSAGDDLEVRPAAAVPPELLAELRAHKPEVLRHLAAPPVAEQLGGVSPVPPSELVAEVCAMRLDDFARAGLVVTVNSEVLGERVLFASDNARVDPGELRPVYRAHELRALLGLSDTRELRRIHAIKRTFRGTITDTSPARNLSGTDMPR
jgi:hypothetical protein